MVEPFDRQDPHEAPRILSRYRHLLVSAASLYGLQIATLVIPLVLLPFLTRRLGPHVWGVLAVQTSLSTVLIVLLEYGFGYGAVREAAAVRGNRTALGRIVSNLVAARVLISLAVVVIWIAVWFSVPVVREQSAAYWWTLFLTLVQGNSPSWFFQALGRLPQVMLREFGARVFSTVAILGLVHGAAQAWLVPALQSATIAISLAWNIAAMIRLVDYAAFSPVATWEMLRANAHLCLTRLVQAFAPMGNTFFLGVINPQAAVFYAPAERTANAVRSLLQPVSQVAFPEIVVLYAQNPERARRAVRRILLYLVLGALLMSTILWLLAGFIVHVLFGPQYQASTAVFRVLVASVPLFGIVQVVGLQWLLPLKHDRAFFVSALIGAIMDVGLGLLFAPSYGAVGMAWGLFASEAAITLGLFIFTDIVGPRELRIIRRA